MAEGVDAQRKWGNRGGGGRKETAARGGEGAGERPANVTWEAEQRGAEVAGSDSGAEAVDSDSGGDAGGRRDGDGHRCRAVRRCARRCTARMLLPPQTEGASLTLAGRRLALPPFHSRTPPTLPLQRWFGSNAAGSSGRAAFGGRTEGAIGVTELQTSKKDLTARREITHNSNVVIVPHGWPDAPSHWAPCKTADSLANRGGRAGSPPPHARRGSPVGRSVDQ